MTQSLLLKNGRLIDPLTGHDSIKDVLINKGVIEQIGSGILPRAETVTIDLSGMIIAPGLLDMHVHLREPGFEHKETIETGTLAAIHGGFTSVCCMPNTNPAIDDESLVRFVHTRGKEANDGIVDVYPIGAITKGREGKELAPIAEIVHAGAVALSDDGAVVHDAEIMRRALEYANMYDVPLIQHCEDPALVRGGAMNEGFTSTVLGIKGMPRIAEEIILARDIILTEYTGARFHAAHISTQKSVDLIREAKRKGIRVTCEVAPHHFSLTDDAVRSFDTYTKMNPPLRTQEDIQAIKEGLKDGTIDVIASDHAPHSHDEKEVDYLQAPFGIAGLETIVGLALTELFHSGVLTLPEVIAKLSTAPRSIVKKEVVIAAGNMANLTIIDPEYRWVVNPADFKSMSKNSPFRGKELRGKAIGIVNNGTYKMY